MTTEDLEKVYDRLRETEAQTREQGVRIDALVSRLDSSTATNQSYISIIQQMMAKSEKREEWFWKILMFLLATVMALALGPKMADKIMSMGVSTMDIVPWHNDKLTLEDCIA